MWQEDVFQGMPCRERPDAKQECRHDTDPEESALSDLNESRGFHAERSTTASGYKSLQATRTLPKKSHA